MGRDTATGKNKKWGRHVEKQEEELTEEAILEAMNKKSEQQSLFVHNIIFFLIYP